MNIGFNKKVPGLNKSHSSSSDDSSHKKRYGIAAPAVPGISNKRNKESSDSSDEDSKRMIRKPEINVPDLGKPKIPTLDKKFEIKQPGVPEIHRRDNSKSSSESSDDDKKKLGLNLGGIPAVKRRGFDDSSSDSSDEDVKAKLNLPSKPEI